MPFRKLIPPFTLTGSIIANPPFLLTRNNDTRRVCQKLKIIVRLAMLKIKRGRFFLRRKRTKLRNKYFLFNFFVVEITPIV